MGSRYFSSSKVGALAERLGNALQMRIRSVRLRWAPLTEFHQGWLFCFWVALALEREPM